MKLLLIVLTSALIQQSLQQSLEQLKEVAEASVVDCYEDEENTKKIEITEAGFEDIGKCSPDADRNAKCIRYCILRKHNWFSSNSFLNESGIVPFFEYSFEDAFDRNHVKKIVAACNMEISEESDRCERSNMATTCILKHLNESGMKIP